MAKQIIRLTESDLRNIVKGSVRQIISEQNQGANADQRFDWCGDFHEGYAVVELNGRYNWIDTDGKLLSPKWFDWCDNFEGGRTMATIDGKRYSVDTDGNLNQERFDWCGDFHEGYAVVKLNGRYNWIDTDGKLLSPKWFDWCGNFEGGRAMATIANKRYSVDTDGNIMARERPNANESLDRIVRKSINRVLNWR